MKPRSKVLIAAADGEEHLAEELAEPLRQKGYDVAHRGTVLVGDSILEEADRLLLEGCAVLVCGTVKSVGTGWAIRVVNAARMNSENRVLVLRFEKEAFVDLLAADTVVGEYWRTPASTLDTLFEALERYYPVKQGATEKTAADAEARYRELALRAHDIIDLANLPEDDRHIATRQLELRRLYVALRLTPHQVSFDNSASAVPEAARVAMLPAHRRLSRRSLGNLLQSAPRLVILGDPGAGKSTLLRWVATSYLLRLSQDPDWSEIPDVADLPKTELLPLLIRCRDFDARSGIGTLEEVIGQSLRKHEVTDSEIVHVKPMLLNRLKDGTCLLLIDGLDEIPDPASRTRFCKHLEQIHIAYPEAMIVVTSRLVGYREMGYHIGQGFTHVQVADLSPQEKDEFAQRWCNVTEPASRVTSATDELRSAIHSTDRIERLTGNPMLLTTMALVKRKVGKLPTRRADLYWDAMEVLLNWRSEVDEPLDKREALPQLQYVAYAMCNAGVQRLREDEILILLEKVREEYPQIRAIKQREPVDFLNALERRTAILSQTGHVRHLGRPVPVYEFRHLTFQEYLAGLALVDGKFPGRDRDKSLAANVAPLPRRTVKTSAALSPAGRSETMVTETWREALRLCVASCGDDDVDDVILAILCPQEDEPKRESRRARAVLAAECLSDEPNVSAAVADAVLRSLAECTDRHDGSGDPRSTGIDSAVDDLASSIWRERLQEVLIAYFFSSTAAVRTGVGGVFALTTDVPSKRADVAVSRHLARLVRRYRAGDLQAGARMAMTVMNLAYHSDWGYRPTPSIIPALLDLVEEEHPAAILAGSWALMLLIGQASRERDKWPFQTADLSDEQWAKLARAAHGRWIQADALYFLWFTIKADPRRIEFLEQAAKRISQGSVKMKRAAAEVLRGLQDERAVSAIVKGLDDRSPLVRKTCVLCLAAAPLRAEEISKVASLVDDIAVDVRIAAINFLGDLGHREARVRIEGRLALSGISSEELVAIVRALGQMKDEESVQPLMAAFARSPKRAILDALVDIGGTRSRQFIHDIGKSSDERVQSLTSFALLRLGDESSLDMLASHVRSEFVEVRRAAVEAVARSSRSDATRRILSIDYDGVPPFRDPENAVEWKRVARQGKILEIDWENVRVGLEACGAILKIDFIELIGLSG